MEVRTFCWGDKAANDQEDQFLPSRLHCQDRGGQVSIQPGIACLHHPASLHHPADREPTDCYNQSRICPRKEFHSLWPKHHKSRSEQWYRAARRATMWNASKMIKLYSYSLLTLACKPAYRRHMLGCQPLAGTRALQRAPQRQFGPNLRILWWNHGHSVYYI